MQTQKSGYLLDRNVTPPGSVASYRTSPSVRLLQLSLFFLIFFFTCFVRLLVPFSSLLLHILSLQYSSFLFLPTFHSLSILALVPALSPLLSDKLFVGRNLRHGLLSCSQVLSLSLFLCLSILQRATGKALPPLPLSGCHRFLSTLIVPRTHYLSHTPKHKYNVLIFTYNMQHLDKMLF